MREKNLEKLCSELSYSIHDALTNEIFISTFSSLKLLWDEYGYANVFGTLAKLWSLEKAIPFFTKANLKTNNSTEIKTIATQYHRAYNGGVVRVQAQLMTLWVKMGYRVVLLTEAPENELDYPYPKSVKRVLIPCASNLTERLSTIQKYCQEEHIDLYMNHDWTNPAILWECLLLKTLHVPYIQYIHGHFAWSIWENKQALYQPELFKLCDIVLSLSETNARFYQLCGCKSYLVQNPVPEDLANNTSLSPLNSKHILMVGRISPEKNPMDALQIFKLVHDKLPNTFLDIIGSDNDNYIPHMRTYIAENSLDKYIIFYGEKKQAEIAQFYKTASCVLFTSEMEGYPMVVLESKAYGLPLVMYDLPYLSLVKDGKGILTAPIGNIAKMSEHIIKLLSNDSYREEMGKAAKESFDNFNAYDLEGTWKNIIALCTTGSQLWEDPAYFNPDNITNADKLIEPMLLDSIKKGYDYILENSLDYRIGRKILKYPRKIRDLLIKMKGITNHGN